MEIIAYLSGGMEYAENYGADWRTEIEKWLSTKLHHGVFNPVKGSELFLGSKYPGVDFRKMKSDDLDGHRQIAKEIAKLDCREIILRSDYVICYYDESAQRGAGTKGELTIASMFGKPVYFVAGMDIANIPTWVLGCTDKMFHDFTSLKDFLSNHFL